MEHQPQTRALDLQGQFCFNWRLPESRILDPGEEMNGRIHESTSEGKKLAILGVTVGWGGSGFGSSSSSREDEREKCSSWNGGPLPLAQLLAPAPSASYPCCDPTTLLALPLGFLGWSPSEAVSLGRSVPSPNSHKKGQIIFFDSTKQ